jgi:hypothetical protein
LVEIRLRLIFLIFQGDIYEKISGVAMRCPLSAIVEYLLMEHFEKRALVCYTLKLDGWVRFTNEINIK